MSDAGVETSPLAAGSRSRLPASPAPSTPPFRAAIADLAAAGFRPCLMRDAIGELDDLEEVDLLVDLRHLDDAARRLQAAGWELADRGLFYFLHRTLVTLHNGRFLKVDLQGGLIDGPFIYMDSDWMLDTAKPDASGLLLPSPEAWLLHNILHVVLGKPALAERRRDRVERVLSGPLDRDSILRQAHRYGLRELVEGVLEAPVTRLADPTAVRALRRRARRALLINPPGNLARLFANRFMWTVGRLAGLRRGFVIAVMGPDGSGKTSFIRELDQELGRLGIRTGYAYMGPWEQHLLPTTWFLRRLGAGLIDAAPRRGDKTRLHRRFLKRLDPRGTLRRYAWTLNLVPEMWARYIFRVQRRSFCHLVVLSDRCVDDIELGEHNVISDQNLRLRRLVGRLIPRPHAVVLLDNDAEVIWARKKEYSLETTRDALEAYRKLAREKGYITVRSVKNPDDLAGDFVAQNWRGIIRCLRDGWSKRF